MLDNVRRYFADKKYNWWGQVLDSGLSDWQGSLEGDNGTDSKGCASNVTSEMELYPL